MKVKVISLPYIFKVLYVLCFTRPRYQVSVYKTIGTLVILGLTSIQKTGPDIIPYIFFEFQICIARFFVNSIKRVIRHTFSAPSYEFQLIFQRLTRISLPSKMMVEVVDQYIHVPVSLYIFPCLSLIFSNNSKHQHL